MRIVFEPVPRRPDTYQSSTIVASSRAMIDRTGPMPGAMLPRRCQRAWSAPLENPHEPASCQPPSPGVTVPVGANDDEDITSGSTKNSSCACSCRHARLVVVDLAHHVDPAGRSAAVREAHADLPRGVEVESVAAEALRFRDPQQALRPELVDRLIGQPPLALGFRCSFCQDRRELSRGRSTGPSSEWRRCSSASRAEPSPYPNTKSSSYMIPREIG